jgi:hypothetical protein
MSMKIEQVFKADHDRRIGAWYQAAMNDPTVHPFLSMSAWRSVPAASDDDWGNARFMDDGGRGLLSVSMDRERQSVSIGLWVLGGDTSVAAALMLYAIRRVPRRYNARHLCFSIAENNAAWRDRALKSAARWLWGREPEGAYDVVSGKWVSVLCFKVPVAELTTRGQRK